MVEHINPQGMHHNPPSLASLVHGLANPDFLVEIEAVAVRA